MNEIGAPPEEVKKTPLMSRRRFIQGVAMVAGGRLLGGSSTIPTPQRSVDEAVPQVSPQTAKVNSEVAGPVEKEPKKIPFPLVVDFPPTARNIQEAKDSGLLNQETEAFDLPSFFDRLTGSSYTKLDEEFQRNHSKDLLPSKLYQDDGLRYLLDTGKEKEALCLRLAMGWSTHGLEVAQTMRNYRDQQEYVQKIREHNPKFPNDPSKYMDTQKVTPKFVKEPYTILPLQHFISTLEKSEKTDEFGNPYYMVKIDHKALAQAIKQSPQRDINCSLALGEIPVRLGYTLRDGEAESTAEGWMGDVYAGNRTEHPDGTVTYRDPLISIESPYPDEKSLEAIKEFAAALPEKTIVMASGNSAGSIPDTFQVPENVVLVATWDTTSEKPNCGFQGSPGKVYYADPSIANSTKMSSFATAMVTELLCEESNPDQNAKQLLNEHSKIKVDGNWQVLDAGMVTAGTNDWNDPEKYKQVVNN